MRKSYSKSKNVFIILGILGIIEIIFSFLVGHQKRFLWFQSIIYPDYIKFSRILDNFEKHPRELRSYEPEFINFLDLWPDITNKSNIESIIPIQRTEISNESIIRSGIFLVPLNQTQVAELRNIDINNKIEETQASETITDPLQKKTRLAALSIEKYKNKDKLYQGYQNKLFVKDIRNDLERKLEDRVYIIEILLFIIGIVKSIISIVKLGYRYLQSCRHMIGL